MFTIKYTDRDGLERLAQGTDIRVRMDGKQAKLFGWACPGGDCGCTIDYPTTVYVMNESGATVGKYVVVANPK